MMEHPQSPDKKKAKLWLIGCGVAAVLLALFLCLVVIVIAILVPSFSASTSSADKAQAKTTLRNAVTAVEQYAVDNDGYYTTMTAAKLSAINSDISWVDGDPGPGQVGYGNPGEATYTLTYKNADGLIYTAKKKDTGEIIYMDSSGQPLL
jgi:type II secretory pathway pseudopilin PulG